MTGLDATIARALSGYDAGDVLSFDSLREAANAAQLTPRQLHGQILHDIHAGYVEPLRAVVDGIEEALLKQGVKPLRREGEAEGRWVLLDYNDIVVHVQQSEERFHYALERLWRDCPTIPLPADVTAHSGG